MSPINLVLRPALATDAAMLRSWESAPHLAGRLGEDDWQWETTLAAPEPSRQPLIAELRGRPIGFVEILCPALDPEHYWGEVPDGWRAVDIWIGEPDAVGRGHGSEMMRQALARCFASPGVTAVVVDPLASNLRAQGFYARFGFRAVERKMFGADDTLVMRLDRPEWRMRERRSSRQTAAS